MPLALLGTGLDAVHAGAGAWRSGGSGALLRSELGRCSNSSADKRAGVVVAARSRAGSPCRWPLLGAFWCCCRAACRARRWRCCCGCRCCGRSRDLPPHGEAELTCSTWGRGCRCWCAPLATRCSTTWARRSHDGYDAGERAVVPALARARRARARRGDRQPRRQRPRRRLAAVRAGVPGPRTGTRPRAAATAARGPCLAGQAWQRDGVRFRFLHPPPHFPYLRQRSQLRAAHRNRARRGAADRRHRRGGRTRSGPDATGAAIARRRRPGPPPRQRRLVRSRVHPRDRRAPCAGLQPAHGNRFGHPRPRGRGALARGGRAGPRHRSRRRAARATVGRRAGDERRNATQRTSAALGRAPRVRPGRLGYAIGR